MRKFLGLLVILIVIVGVVGWYRGWFTFSTSQDTGNEKIDVDLRIDRTKIRADTSAAEERARQLGDRVTKQVQGAKEETANGKVMKVAPELRELTIRAADDRQVTFVVQEGASVESKAGGQRLEDLKSGQNVRVDYRAENGKLVAHRISVQSDVEPH